MSVKVFSRVYAMVACGLWLATPPDVQGGWHLLTGVAVAAIGVGLAHHYDIRIVLQQSIMNSAVTSVAIVVGVIEFGALPVLLGGAVGLLPTAWTFWRFREHATTFNAAVFLAEVWLTHVLFHIVGPSSPGVLSLAVLVVAAVIAQEVLSGVSVIGIMHVHSGVSADTVRSAGRTAALTCVISIPVTVLAVVLLDGPVWALLPLAALVVLIVRISRSQHGMVGQQAGVARLYEFIGRLERERDADTLIRMTLEEASVTLSAIRTGLLLDDEQSAHLHLLDGDEATVTAVDGAIAGALLDRCDHATQIDADALEALSVVTPLQMGAAVVAPFSGEGIRGMLLVQREANTQGLLDEDDLKLAQAMARNAGRALLTIDVLDQLEQRAADLQRAAHHDQTTGLRNIDGLTADIPVLHAGVLVIIELLDLPMITSALGRLVATDAERATGDRLEVLGGLFGHHVGHIAPGRFAVVMPDVSQETADPAIARIRDLLSGTLTDAQGFGLEARIAVGAALTEVEQPLDELLRQATNALIEHGKPTGEVGWFTPELDEAATDRLAMAAELRAAIDDGQLSLAYQPKVHIGTGRIVGAEALCRWIHPERGFISPAVFIDLAERTGLIRDLTRSVVTTAVRQAAEWDAKGHPLSVAVNLSAMSLEDDDLTEWIVAACHEEGLPVDRLTCEVTESQVMGDLERCRATLQRMRDAGLRLSIDDFGTGHSSLAQLKTMPADELKIDRAFVMHLAADAADRAIAQTIISMARTFGLKTVAEGIEDAETLAVLADLGCDVAQGYHLHRPMPASAFDDILQVVAAA